MRSCWAPAWAGLRLSLAIPILERDRLSETWAAGDDRARNKVEAILTKAGLTIDQVTAQTRDSKLESFERLDRMLASAEARRNDASTEIDRHVKAHRHNVLVL